MLSAMHPYTFGATRAAGFVLLTFLSAAGCATPRSGLPAEPFGGGADARTKASLRPTLGHPAVLDDNGLVVIPFALESPDAGRDKLSFSPNISSGSYFSVSSSSSGLGSFAGKPAGDAFSLNVEWHNVFFVDESTGETRLLLDRRAVICDFIRPGYRVPPTDPADAAAQPTKADYFLVGLAEADTNGDRLINGADAVVLHHCDLAGRKLTPLTPAGAQFVGVSAARPDRLLLRVRRDGDGNRRFDERDATTLLRVDPRRPGVGAEIVSEGAILRAAEIVTR